ncbi:glycosyltransferase family 2 protein [Desulfonatronum parangueonense]
MHVELPRISLCTYTYNDARLVRELLATLQGWTVKPSEIIIVDDGSEPAFGIDAETTSGHIPFRILRHQTNFGCAAAKNAGITAAQGEYVLSMDCDIRLPADWLESCLPYAARKDIGLIGSSIVCNAGNSLTGRYLRMFHGHPQSGSMDFLTGGIWFLRKKIWRESGGLSEYRHRTHEDHHFCKKLRQMGYLLYAPPNLQATQVRKLSLNALIMRQWAWFADHEMGKLKKSSSMEVCVVLFMQEMLHRINHVLNNKDPALIYIEFLYMSHVFLHLMDQASLLGIDEPLADRVFFLTSMKELFQVTPPVAFPFFSGSSRSRSPD